MTYATLDTSVDRGAPFELYEFTMLDGSLSWNYCDSLEGYPGYVSTQITRSNIVRDAELIGSGLSITTAYNNPLALDLLANLSSYPIKVLIKAGHVGDPDGQLLPIYRGMVAGVHFNGAQAEITCVSRFALSTQKKIPWITTQAGCNWELGGEGCGVNLTSFTSSTVIHPSDQSGNALTVALASTKPDGYYSGGYLRRPFVDGATRFIRKHVGDQLLLDRPFTGMSASGDVYHLVPGCKKTESDCQSRYSNLSNYLGWSRLPSVNPFNRSAFYLSSTPSAPASSWELPPPYAGYSLLAKDHTVISYGFSALEGFLRVSGFTTSFYLDGTADFTVGHVTGTRREGWAWSDPTPLPSGAADLFDVYFSAPVILEGPSSTSLIGVLMSGGTPVLGGTPTVDTWIHLTSPVTLQVMVEDTDGAFNHFKVKVPYRIRERSSGFWRAQGDLFLESNI